MPRSLKGMLGTWAARIRELHVCSLALELFDPNNPDAITVCEEVIEDEIRKVLDGVASGLRDQHIERWHRWTIEALFHRDVRNLLSPTFFSFFKVGERIGEGDLRFVDEILHGDAFGPKAALVWWTYSLDRQRGLDSLRKYHEESDGIGRRLLEDDAIDFQADMEFVSEDARSFAKIILEATEKHLSSEARRTFEESSAARASWLALMNLTKFTVSLTRTSFYEGHVDNQGRRQEGAYALARSYYNDACRLDQLRKVYAFLKEPY